MGVIRSHRVPLEESNAMANSHKVVLVIEDDANSRRLFRVLLEINGYSVLQASEGIEGWNSALKHRPDLILLDIQLPDISGLAVARLLKEHEALKSIPIVAVTAFALEGDQQKMLNGGCDAYVAKPISISSLMQEVELLLAKDNLALESV